MVMICLLTTPTRAYEAYRISPLFILEHAKVVTMAENTPVAEDDLCGLAANKISQEYQIKPELLQTIASVESGRWVEEKQQRIAWPWTVQANGSGHYYKSKEEAVKAVKLLQEKGIKNIDVGCMQINLKYHGHAFNSVEDALEPTKNVAYSAEFLRKLYHKTGNWQKTAMQYHSKNHNKGMIYKKRLEKHYAEYIKPESDITLF